MENKLELTKEKNNVALERLKLCEQYFSLMDSVEQLLAEYRSNLAEAKTKNILGRPSSNASDILSNMKEMEPTIWTKFDVTSAHYTLSDGKDEEPDNEDDGLRKRQQTDSKTPNPKKENKASTFRPFGIFEPQSVKIARKNIQSLLPLLCDLSNIRAQIRALDFKMNRLKTQTEI